MRKHIISGNNYIPLHVIEFNQIIYSQAYILAPSRNHCCWKRNNMFPLYCCWRTCSCHQHESVHFCHGYV